MTTTSENMLLQEVQPRLRSGIARYVPQVGCDDESELLQDGMVMAMRLVESAEAAGKQVTPGNIAYFTLKNIRAGRRSTGFYRTDPLHPATQTCGRSRVHSLDEPVGTDESSDEPQTLGETLASRADDPATEAARSLDWSRLVARLDNVAKAVLRCLASGRDLTLLVPKLGRSRSALQNDKVRLANLVRECLGDNIVSQVLTQPAWHDNVDAARDRQACRWDRQAA